MCIRDRDNASFLGSYNGKFIFAPYRRLTDDELADMLFLKDVQNQCEGLDLDLLERNARLAIHEAGYPPVSYTHLDVYKRQM